jgi:uncharacterized Zn finger protein
VTAADKARQLVANGAVQVLTADENHVAARVRGRHGIFDVNRLGGRWSCTCPALGPCSHALAVRSVTTRPTAKHDEVSA